MIQHKIQTYLDLGTLVPTNTQVGTDVASSEWWSKLSPMFDDLIWLYYGDRTVFLNNKFNPQEPSNCRENIIRTFGIYLKSRCRQIDRIYDAFMRDFNPLWNVDGVEGFISKDTHTGTDTQAHRGKDTTLTEDNGTITKSGNESIASSGSDTSIDSNTTYNSSTFFEGDKNVIQHGKTDTHNYNNVKDTRDLDGKNETSYNSDLTNTKDLIDEHVDLKIRRGNIGVTQSDKILGDSMRLYMDELTDFFKYVVRCCVNQVSYAVE